MSSTKLKEDPVVCAHLHEKVYEWYLYNCKLHLDLIKKTKQNIKTEQKQNKTKNPINEGGNPPPQTFPISIQCLPPFQSY